MKETLTAYICYRHGIIRNPRYTNAEWPEFVSWPMCTECHTTMYSQEIPLSSYYADIVDKVMQEIPQPDVPRFPILRGTESPSKAL